MSQDTLDGASGILVAVGRPVPGVVVVYSDATPMCQTVPLEDGELALGRVLGSELPDARVSRAHARIRLDGRRWIITDLESRNGTFVDGGRVTGELTFAAPRVLRIGHTLLLPLADVRALRDAPVLHGEHVIGPALHDALDRIARHAQSSPNLLVLGETGSGKELAARTFHARGPRPKGPFVAVNCATIPEGVAERLLFGARKGAFSGATADADGYVQAAQGGTLFLDEIGELDPQVQAKLLRMLEAREVMALGASVPTPIDVRVCWATHRDLRGLIAKGSFREDLFYRIAQPTVTVPPLRDRLEEIPFLVAQAVGPTLSAHARLIERCILRPWPGNVRELLSAIRHAAGACSATDNRVRPEDLDPNAGLPPVGSPPAASDERQAVAAALAAAGGNISVAARALGMHRTQLYRLLKRLGLG